MAKVFVTGASGFIGGHLVPVLIARGDEVYCLVRPGSPKAESLSRAGAHVVTGDLVGEAPLTDAVRGMDIVYHLGGIVRARSTAEFFRVNEHGTRRLLDACAQQDKPPVVLQVSSLSAAGPSTRFRPHVESDEPQPVSNYGRSKRAAEVVAQEFAGRVPITIVRPPIVSGEGDTLCLDMFKSIAHWGIHVQPGWRSQRYSIIHVKDLVVGLIAAAERGERLAAPSDASSQPGRGVYYFADDRQPTYRQLGKLVGRAVGRRRIRVLRVGPFMTYGFGAVAGLMARLRRRASFISVDKAREAMAGSWTCSPEKAHRDLSFYTAAPLRKRLAETADWYRHSGWI